MNDVGDCVVVREEEPPDAVSARLPLRGGGAIRHSVYGARKRVSTIKV
jgi:hypothetical protein